MLKYFNKLLFFLGIRHSQPQQEKSIDQTDLTCKFSPKCIEGYYIYTLFIFLILLIEPILTLSKIIQQKSYKSLPLFSYMLIVPIQYIHTIRYFNIKKHTFHDLYNAVYNGQLVKKYCLPNDRNLTISIIGFSSLSIIFSLFTLTYAYLSPAIKYDLEYSDNKVILYIVRTLTWIYGRTIVSLNIHIFYYVFCKHLKDLKYVRFVLKKGETLDTFCNEIIDIRHRLRTSINKLQPIYVTSTLIGSFAIGNIIKYKIFVMDILFTSAIFFIIQCILIFIIYGVSYQRTKLLEYINESTFISKFILKKNKQIIHNIKKQRRLSEIPTIKLDNHADSKIVINITTKSPSFDAGSVINEKKDNQTEDIKCIKELSNITSLSVDWIILNTILKEEWANFTFLGINLNDGSIIGKATMISGGIVAITNYISQI